MIEYRLAKKYYWTGQRDFDYLNGYGYSVSFSKIGF